MTSKSGIKAINEELKKHRGDNPELEKLIDLYGEIFKVQESTRLKAGPVRKPKSYYPGYPRRISQPA